MEHLAETMTDFLLRHKYITEEQAEWCHYIYIECGDCQRAVSRSCKNLLCVFDTTGAPVIVPVHDVEYLFSTTVDKSECRAILTKANFCELYKGWIDEHIRDLPPTFFPAWPCLAIQPLLSSMQLLPVQSLLLYPAL